MKRGQQERETGALRAPASNTAEAVARALGVEPRLGLSIADAKERARRFGPNALRQVRPVSSWVVLGRQFASWIVALLGVAAVVAFFAREWLDGGAILAVLVLNSLIGFVTELRAARSMEALRQLGSVRAHARREGEVHELDAEELVPGDVVLLDAGDVITADLRILEASKLEVDESALTGESLPVSKSAEPVAPETLLADRTSLLFKGTALTRGNAEAVVTAIGMETELGHIAALVQQAAPETTPLEKQLAILGKRLVWATVVIALITISAGVLGGHPLLLMVETGIALAVAAIPEGLPIVATLALARGMWRMARRHALVNRLSAVETLGATTLIFSDKTGTLTQNRMVVRRMVCASGEVRVEEERLELAGQPVELTEQPGLQACIEVAVLCNNASLGTTGHVLGDPMEVALLQLGEKVGLKRAALVEAAPEVREEAFDPSTLMMATLHREASGLRVAVKGAMESVLAACETYADERGEAQPLGEAQREQWEAEAMRLATEGLRVLGLAQRRVERDPESIYEGLCWLGLLALADPPRVDVRAAIADCRAAGIGVIMVTGDHAATAASIARDVGLSDTSDERVVRGAELDGLAHASAEEREALLAARIYSRVTPAQKLELIQAHQERGAVVAMTGDGVNDAPALRKADIGVAMGLGGTQVAREAAAMVLTDDAFPSIVAAIAQGRVIFDNIRRFVFYLLSCNVSEVAVVSLAAVVGVPLPLLPLQILFLNLVTDVFPALALAFGEGDPDVLERAPRDPREPIISRRQWFEIFGFAALISVCVLGALYVALNVLHLDRTQAVTVSFVSLALAQLLHVFNARASGRGPLRNEVTTNPWVWGAIVLCAVMLFAAVRLPGLSHALSTSDPGPLGWALALGVSAVPLLVGSVWRLWQHPE